MATSPPGRHRLERLLDVLVMAGAPALGLLLALHGVVNHDLGFHLRTGELVLSSGIPTSDPFSFTIPGEPWFLEQWLGATAFHAVASAIGVEGLVLFKAALVALTFLVVVLTGRRTSGNMTAATAAALLAVVAAAMRFRAQPYVFSFLALALTCYLLERYRHEGSTRSLWPLALLFAVWPHVHVGYLYGLAAVGSYAAGAVLERALRRRASSVVLDSGLAGGKLIPLLLVGGASGAIALSTLALVHPMGLGVVQRVWGIFASDFYRQHYEEMRSLLVAYGINLPVIVLWGLPAVVWLALRQRLVLPHVALFAVFVFTGLRVGRVVAEASVVVAPVWAACITAALDRLQAAGRLDNLRRLLTPVRLQAGVVVFVLLTGMSYARQGYGTELGWVDYNYPRSCYEWIDDHDLPPRMFNDMFFGGTFIHYFYPRRRVFIDGRTVYSEAFFRDAYEPIKRAEPGWERLVDTWGIEWFLLATMRFGRLHRALQASPDWDLAHVDGTCAIYTAATVDAAAGARRDEH